MYWKDKLSHSNVFRFSCSKIGMLFLSLARVPAFSSTLRRVRFNNLHWDITLNFNCNFLEGFSSFHMKQLKKKAPDIVIPLIVRVNVLAFLSFFLSFFLSSFFFFWTMNTATKNIQSLVQQHSYRRIILKLY